MSIHSETKRCINIILSGSINDLSDTGHFSSLFLIVIEKSRRKRLIFVVFFYFLSQVSNVIHLSNRERASLADFLTSLSFLPFKIDIRSLNQYILRRMFSNGNIVSDSCFFSKVSLETKILEPPMHTFKKTHVSNDEFNI